MRLSLRRLAPAFAVAALAGCVVIPQASSNDPGGGSSGTTPDGGVVRGTFAWSTRAPLPLPRTDHGVAAVGAKVYAFGGYSGSMLARVDEYDPRADAWTRKADMPEPRRGFASGVIDGKIYVAGGMSFSDWNMVTYLKSTIVFDPAANTWTPLAPCPLGSAPNNVWGNLFVGGGAMNGLFYVMESSPGGTSMHVYDPKQDAWTTEPAGAFNGAQPTAASLADVLYVFASPFGPGPQSGGLWSWYATSGDWVIRQSLPLASRSALFAMNGKLYSAAGITGDSATVKATPAIWEYDPAREAWTQRGALGVAREYAGAAVIGNSVYVVGGDVPPYAQQPVPSASVEVGLLQ